MSQVTDIILCCSLTEEMGDDNFPPIMRINAWLESENKGSLSHLNRAMGGHKAMQADVFGGAFNYLDIERFISIVCDAGWENPSFVQVLIKGEDDELFGLVHLKDPEDSRLLRKESEIAQEAVYYRERR